MRGWGGSRVSVRGGPHRLAPPRGVRVPRGVGFQRAGAPRPAWVEAVAGGGEGGSRWPAPPGERFRGAEPRRGGHREEPPGERGGVRAPAAAGLFHPWPLPGRGGGLEKVTAWPLRGPGALRGLPSRVPGAPCLGGGPCR